MSIDLIARALAAQSKAASGPGLSAYEVALQQGFVGSEVEWLASLVGEAGVGVDPATVEGLQAALAAALDRIAVLESPDALTPLTLEPNDIRDDAQPGDLVGLVNGLHPFEEITVLDDANDSLVFEDGAVRVGAAPLGPVGEALDLILQRRLAKPGRAVIEIEASLTVTVVAPAGQLLASTGIARVLLAPGLYPPGTPVTITNPTGSPINFRLGPPAALPTYSIAGITPHASWTGAYETWPASGTPPPTPVAREVAKPTLHLLTIDREAFTGDYLIHAVAFAKGGVDFVRFTLSGGEPVDVHDMHPVIVEDGTDEGTLAWAYSVRLDYNAFPEGVFGWCDLYIEAFPTNPAFQKQQIGPFSWKRKPVGQKYDGVIKFGPSYAANGDVSQPNLRAATNRVATHPATGAGAWEHVCLEFDESHSFDLASIASGANAQIFANGRAGQRGWIDVVGRDGAVLSIVNSNAAAAQYNMRPNTEYLRYCKGVAIDVLGVAGMSATGVLGFWGCEVFSSGGVAELVTNTKTVRQSPPTNAAASGYFYGVHWRDQLSGPKSTAARVIGGRYENIAEDLFTSNRNGYCVYGPRVSGHSANAHRSGHAAIALTYSGPAASARYSVLGNLGVGDIYPSGVLSPNANACRVVLNIDGTTYEYRASATQGYGAYNVSDIVSAINADTGTHGVAAVLLYDDWRAVQMGGLPQARQTNVDIKGGGGDVTVNMDIHGDLYQLGLTAAAAVAENILICNIISVGAWDIQTVFLDNNTSNYMRDSAVINVVSDVGRIGGGAKSQLSGNKSHVLVWGCTLPWQELLLNPVAGSSLHVGDEHCSIVGNISSAMTIPSGSMTMEVQRNHQFAGAAPSPANATVKDNTTGSSAAICFPAGADLDLHGAGPLVDGTLIGAASTPFDAEGRPRASVTAPGGLENYPLLTPGREMQIAAEWIDEGGIFAVTNDAEPGAAPGGLLLAGVVDSEAVERTIPFRVSD